MEEMADTSAGPLADDSGADEPAASDSGVETCGRALSSGGGSRSCASSVVSCGSACGSESSSLAGAPRPRRRVAVTAPEPPARPLGASTPRTVPRGPNLATRERARSREKPTLPEKPRPPTPKPRVRPPGELPALARESPALRVKQTRTSTARCRPSTPNSPTGVAARLTVAELGSSAARVTADKYATLPRRRRDAADGSPRRGTSVGRDRDVPAPTRRPALARAASSRAAPRSRVRIYAEASSQTALMSADVEAALAGRAVRLDMFTAEKISRGVQAERRDVELERLEGRYARAAAEAQEERARRVRLESELEAERALRAAAQDELARNTRRLLELSGVDGAGGECLRALEEQLQAAARAAAHNRTEIDALRATCSLLQAESSASAQAARALERRLAESEAEAAEMQDFLSAEKHSLQESLRDAERELVRRRAECRQLVRLCEQRRQEALGAAARGRGGGGAGAALDLLARRLRALLDSLHSGHLPPEADEPALCNDACSRSESSGGRTPEEPPSWWWRSESRDERSDNSADLLDSETEPCLVTDAAFEESSAAPDQSSPQATESRHATRADALSLYVEGGGAGAAGAWSADELSPVRADESSERASLHSLSAAILQRQQSEHDQPRIHHKVVCVEGLVSELARAVRARLAQADASHKQLQAARARETGAGAGAQRACELDSCRELVAQHQRTVQELRSRLEAAGVAGVAAPDLLAEVQESAHCAARYEALDACLGALAARQHVVAAWPRLAALQATLEHLAFALLPRSRPPSPARAPSPPRLALHAQAAHTVDSAA